MRKNNKGLVLPELLTILAFIAVIFAFGAYVSFKNGNERKYEVFAQNAREFATKVTTYRDEHIRYDNEIYLSELVNNNYIKAFKNPFGGGNCNLYESKVVFTSSNQRYVTLRCGDYLIDSQLVSSGNYRVYKVSSWQEKIGNSIEAETAKLYNYKKNGSIILNDYVVEKELIEKFNINENKSIKTIDDINDSDITIVKKSFYRTKKLIKENL